jgi:hypothetical protein
VNTGLQVYHKSGTIYSGFFKCTPGDHIHKQLSRFLGLAETSVLMVEILSIFYNRCIDISSIECSTKS